ncbi:MAG: cyclic nucleotide-binding domain-containing protein [Termitinemataceae bacterium]|nr:MAG: cyclic nucleotide-binding domain-containing protein [Termitinemataceae bacterium]
MANRPQLSVATYSKGTYILIEGKKDTDKFFIIREGQVQLSKSTEVINEGSFNTLAPGDFFGVVAAMSGHSEIESAQALTDVVALCVPRSEFEGLIQFNTPVAIKIIQQFSRRMRFLNDALTKITLHSGNANDLNVLFKIAEYYKKNSLNTQAFYAFKRYCECYPSGAFITQAKEKVASLKDFSTPSFTSDKSPFLRTYKAGSIVFAEGETGEDLFILQAGSVKITKIIDGTEVILAILKSGDIFGEMALLESKPRSATAIAQEQSVLMLVQKNNFEGMAATQPQIIRRLTKLLSERIWFSYKQLSNALIQDPVARSFDTLIINIEKNNVNTASDAAYDFPFGPEELLKMSNVPMAESRTTLTKMMSNPVFSIKNNKIHIANIAELAKICEFNKNMIARSAAMKKKQ